MNRKKRPGVLRRSQLEQLESRMVLHGGGIASGFVYLDVDDSNTKDPAELGVPGIVVNLSGTDVDGSSVERSTLTDDDGQYTFDELEPGTYQISKRQSSALQDGQDATPVVGSTVNNSQFEDVVLNDDDELTDNNFGELGLQPEFINILWLLSSTPPATEMLRETVALAEDINGDSALAQTIRESGSDVPEILNSAPVANRDTFRVTQGETLSLLASQGVLANDVDNEGDALTATIVRQPVNGTLTLNTDGSFSYTPDSAFTGSDSFTYTAGDGELTSNVAEVTIEVAATEVTNQPFGSVTPGNFRDEGLAGTRTDLLPNAPPLNADHVTEAVDYSAYSNPPTYGPHHGFLLDAENNAITPRPTGVYETEQPDEDMVHGLEHGHVWISYNRTLISNADLDALRQFVIDGGENTGVIMTPRAANDSAIAVASWGRLLTLDAFDDAQVRNFVELNRGKSDGEGFIPSGQKADGTASENLSDGLPHTPPVEVANTAPTANNDSFQTDQGSSLTVAANQGVLINDSDDENDPLVAAVESNPSGGSLTLSDDGSFTYVPDAGFTGEDTFTYTANDGELSSNSATVSIDVFSANAAPVASADTYASTENETLFVSVENGVLANDSDPDGDTLSASLANNVSDGQLVLNTDGAFTYTPNTDFVGTDSFTYTVSDGALTSSPAAVSISILETVVQNQPFGTVTPGTFREEGLAGVRTDLLPGALPLNADHVTTDVDYSGYSNPPTYGPHHPFRLDAQRNAITPRPTGVYQTEQPDEDMVHGLEHGHVWISYNPSLISSQDLSDLRQFVIDGGTNTGVIMTPRAANDDAIAVASWARLLTLDNFDAGAIRTFIESNRGKSDGEGFIPSGQKADDAGSENLDDGLPH